MTRWIGRLCIALSAGLVFTIAQAQDVKKGKVDVHAIFKKLDANSDGLVHKSEFLKLADQFKDKAKAQAEKLTLVYDMIDPANTGLSKEQFQTYMDSRKKKSEK